MSAASQISLFAEKVVSEVASNNYFHEEVKDSNYLELLSRDVNELTQFNFSQVPGLNEQYDVAMVSQAKTFFTMPEINLENANLRSSAFLSYLYNANYTDILDQFKTVPSFAKLLTNRLEDCPDFGEASIDIGKIGTNMVGYFVGMADTFTSSTQDVTLNLEFRDCKNLLLTTFFKILREYTEYVSTGRMFMSEEYREDVIIDYPFSIYSFSLDETGSIIQHWCRFTGVIVTRIDYSIFQIKPGEPGKPVSLKVSFHAPIRTDFDPYDLVDFNKITNASASALTGGDGSLSTKPLGLINDNSSRLWTNIKKAARPWTFWNEGLLGAPNDPLDSLAVLTSGQVSAINWAATYRKDLFEYHLPYVVKVPFPLTNHSSSHTIYKPALIYI